MPPGDAPGPGFPSPATDVDAALMQSIACGDAEALSHLYDRHSPLVFAFCLRAMRNRAEAEDLVIDIFWEIWQRRDRYDPSRSSPRTYLLNLTRSRIIDRLRSLRARRSVPAVALDAREGPPVDSAAEGTGPRQPIDEMVGAEQRVRLQSAMQGLNPEQREALELAYFDAMSHSEVAERLGQPLGTVKSRIRQALIRLREILGRSDP